VIQLYCFLASKHLYLSQIELMDRRIRLFKNLLQGVELNLIFHGKSDDLCEGVDQRRSCNARQFVPGQLITDYQLKDLPKGAIWKEDPCNFLLLLHILCMRKGSSASIRT
jgi:hypothetical protein